MAINVVSTVLLMMMFQGGSRRADRLAHDQASARQALAGSRWHRHRLQRDAVRERRQALSGILSERRPDRPRQAGMAIAACDPPDSIAPTVRWIFGRSIRT
jgi:hypothetical protein